MWDRDPVTTIGGGADDQEGTARVLVSMWEAEKKRHRRRPMRLGPAIVIVVVFLLVGAVAIP